MNMTHYMALLADNQPWTLIAFMVIPVVLAETVAITELYVLYHRLEQGAVLTLNRVASIVGGAYFLGVFVYLMNTAVWPLTQGGLWRGPADVMAVGFYLSGVLPLVGLAVIDLRWVGRSWSHGERLAWHAGCVAVFLVVAHVAMIFGMVDPTVMGWQPDAHNPPMEHSGH